MAALDLGDVEDFPFVDPPDRRAVADGLALLEELGALAEPGADGRRRLTDVGRALAALPLDPRLARMVVEADRRGVLEEVLVIAAGLTIQDPRERPAEHQQAADQAHARFADEHSDFLALLNLWRYLGEQADALSGNQFRRTVKREFLHYLRIREWQDLHGQLRGTARRLGMRTGELAAEPDERGISAALLAGLLSHVGAAGGTREAARRPARGGRAGSTSGARGTRFVIAPGTPLAKKPPRWVVAAELVETSRLFARTVARVDPEDVERLAGAPGEAAVLRAAVGRQAGLRRRQRAGHALRHPARRRPAGAVRLDRPGGLPGAVHPARAGAGRVDDAPPVLGGEPAGDRAGRRAGGARPPAGHRRRRRDAVRALRRADPGRRRLHPALRPLVEAGPQGAPRTCSPSPRRCSPTPRRPGRCAPRTIPDAVELDAGGPHPAAVLRVRPGHASDDGVTVDVPLAVLDAVAERTSGESLAFTVPGMREELVTALLRTLPKQLRRALVPIPDRVREVLPRIDAGEPLLPALERELRRAAGVVVPPDAWAPDAGARPPARHVPGARRPAAHRWRPARTSTALRAQVAPQARASLRRGRRRPGADRADRVGVRHAAAKRCRCGAAGHVVTAYPALVDEGTTVGLRVVADRGGGEPG